MLYQPEFFEPLTETPWDEARVREQFNVVSETDPDACERTTLARHAVVEDGLANCPMVTGADLVAWDGQIRLQWCHGGAGVVASAAGYLDEEL